MSEQHPSVEDEIERALRLGLATAGQLADRFARARQDLAREAQHRDQQESRQLEARYQAEGASATARLALVDRPEWWNRATPADITSMWQLAVQWQNEQPRVAVSAATIAQQVQDRYGIDVRDPGIDAETIRAALAQFDDGQRDRARRSQGHDDTATAIGVVLRAEQRDATLPVLADPHEGVAASEASEVDRAVVLDLEADAYDRQAADGDTAALTPEELRSMSADARAQAMPPRSDASAAKTPAPPPYDSLERRSQTAVALHEVGLSADVVAVAMRADVAHARPAADAGIAHAKTNHTRGTRGAARGSLRLDRDR